MREICIDMLYSEVRKEVPISREAYNESLMEWEVTPIIKLGEIIGVVIFKDKEIHMHVKKIKAIKHARWIIRGQLEVRLQEFGFLLTRSHDGSDLFLQRLGFYKTGFDGKLNVYRLDQLRIS